MRTVSMGATVALDCIVYCILFHNCRIPFAFYINVNVHYKSDVWEPSILSIVIHTHSESRVTEKLGFACLWSIYVPLMRVIDFVFSYFFCRFYPTLISQGLNGEEERQDFWRNLLHLAVILRTVDIQEKYPFVHDYALLNWAIELE